MIFFSYHFTIFVVVFFVLYWTAAPWPRLRRPLLLLACAVFHAYFAGPAGVLPIIVLGLGTYAAGLTRNRTICLSWVAVCVAALAFYKYTAFLAHGLIGLVFPAAGDLAYAEAMRWAPAAPPLAISFFTFEFVHYLIEVSRGHRPLRSIVTFGLFSIFWPSLVAGPIKRYRSYVVSLRRGLRSATTDDVLVGAMRLTTGIVKKYCADLLTAWIQYNDSSFETLPLGWRWYLFFAIGARILLDFSGYTDMAIGFARMMGIRLPENFNWPYLSHSIGEFWRRWHISLSSWIRDYVYIPLGGSRHGPVRRAGNAFLAMALCGLWHGAAWNFVIWGLYHGVALAATAQLRAPQEWTIATSGPLAAVTRGTLTVATWAATLIFVHIGWLLFFYPVGRALQMTFLLFSRT